jgi:hypothetical protein
MPERSGVTTVLFPRTPERGEIVYPKMGWVWTLSSFSLTRFAGSVRRSSILKTSKALTDSVP